MENHRDSDGLQHVDFSVENSRIEENKVHQIRGDWFGGQNCFEPENWTKKTIVPVLMFETIKSCVFVHLVKTLKVVAEWLESQPGW